ncbi:MAG: M23 family metallopeptidase [Christensenellaceae bacterium]|jgi:murein DD-endopeptidase MepM/ murein hydrolase activator NlpD|nr:M23 family metallopeptidase [Christensenellaceae bacterium]
MDIRTATQMERAKRKAVAISALLVVVMFGISAIFMALSLVGRDKSNGLPIDNPINNTPDPNDEVPVNAPVAFSIPVQGSEWTVLKAASLTELQRNNTLGRWELHGGYDLGAAAGTAVVAAYDGTVKSVSTGNTLTGTVVRIEHANGLETVYSSLGTVNVVAGATVKKGDAIGTVGDTAGSEKYDTPYVRFETYKDGAQIDPAEYTDFSTK